MAFGAQWYQQFALNGLLVSSTAGWNAAGISKKKLEALVAAGDLVRVRYGAYATGAIVAEAQADPCLAYAVRAAAVRATGSRADSVVSQHSAARMLGLSLLHDPRGEKVSLTVPPGARTGRGGGGDVMVHEASLPRKHVTDLFFGVPVTTGARTVIDIARTRPFMEGVVVADSALRSRAATPAAIAKVLADCGKWPGLERATQVAGFATNLSESVLESCARVVFRDHGLPPPQLQVPIRGKSKRTIAVADFCWPEYGTLADADGMLKYEGKKDMARHLNRDALLQEAGWEDIHFTWAQLFGDAASVVGRIRDSFARGIRLGRRGTWMP
ncbi:MAG: hypothetical protein JWM19_125 [Actinomycetia bacterium]|nr:hypothetical protein [Actinomycetes bacterium]